MFKKTMTLLVPYLPSRLVERIAARYIAAYEKLTGQEFVPGKQPTIKRIRQNLKI